MVRERHSKATLDHSSNFVEVSVPSPQRQSPQLPLDKMKRNPLKGVPKLRTSMFRKKKRANNDNNTSIQNVVVISNQRKKLGLQISIPDSSNDDLPTVIPVSSTQSSTLSPASTQTPEESIRDQKASDLILVKSSSSLDGPPRETFFTITDFSRNNWVETMASQSTDSLSFGFISIMAATVVIHPILFVTGAATAVWAVGVVHAVEKGYEFFSDGQFKNMFWADSDVGLFEDDQKENDEIHRDARTDSHAIEMNPPIGTPAISPSQQVASETKSFSPQMRPPLTPMMSPSNSSRKHVTAMDAAIQQNFPQLETEVVTATFPGLNALEFFHVFLSNDAPYSFKEFQQTRGDVDIEFGDWAKYSTDTVSFHPNVNQTFNLPTCSQKERVMHFKTLTKSYFGPAYASAKKTQRAHKFSTRLVIVESKTELFDIPYSDRFFVVEKWIIESVKHDKTTTSSMLYTTKLTVSVEVFMLKSCSWERQIRQKTLSTMTDFVTSWSEKATQALDLTLKRKLEGMRVLNDAHDNKSLYSYQSKESRKTKSVQGIMSRAKVQANRLPVLPETSRQSLMDIHRERLKKLEEKAASGDLEWCSIELKHCANAGESNAYAKVLDETGVLATDFENELNLLETDGGDHSDWPKEISITTKSSKSKSRGIKNRLFKRKK